MKHPSIVAVKQIQEMGVDVYMLTGDNNATATVIAKQAGIKHYKAEVSPVQKAEFIKQLQQQGNIMAMVGDGINNSNALATAKVSVAMGKRSEIAMDVAKMTIMSSDLTKIPQAIKLSRYTVAAISGKTCFGRLYIISSGFLLLPVFYTLSTGFF